MIGIRYIGESEYQKLIRGQVIEPIDTFKGWSGKKVLFAFLDNGLEGYDYLAYYIDYAYHTHYKYKVYLNLRDMVHIRSAGYDVEVVNRVLGLGDKEYLDFNVDEEIGVYVVPELQFTYYDQNQVLWIEEFNISEVKL